MASRSLRRPAVWSWTLFLALAALRISPTASFTLLAPFSSRNVPQAYSSCSSSSTPTRLFQQPTDDDTHDFTDEEILLRLKLALCPSALSLKQANDSLQRFSESFPFAAVLPVQPMMYLPVYSTVNDSDNNGDKSKTANGVDIKFMRKKTDLKSSIDGGVRFFFRANEHDNSIDVTVKRNSSGQAIRKMIAEKLIVTSYVAGLTGQTEVMVGAQPSPVTDNLVQVTSLFHEWILEEQ